MVALQALFAADVRGVVEETSLDWLLEEEPLVSKARDFTESLLSGVWHNGASLDQLIQRYAPAWPVSQLSLIDRNILRLALYELLYHVGTPSKTAVNEAVELAKIFGSESSARFVNGVLGSVMAGLEAGEPALVQRPPEGR